MNNNCIGYYNSLMNESYYNNIGKENIERMLGLMSYNYGFNDFMVYGLGYNVPVNKFKIIFRYQEPLSYQSMGSYGGMEYNNNGINPVFYNQGNVPLHSDQLNSNNVNNNVEDDKRNYNNKEKNESNNKIEKDGVGSMNEGKDNSENVLNKKGEEGNNLQGDVNNTQKDGNNSSQDGNNLENEKDVNNPGEDGNTPVKDGKNAEKDKNTPVKDKNNSSEDKNTPVKDRTTGESEKVKEEKVKEKTLQEPKNDYLNTLINKWIEERPENEELPSIDDFQDYINVEESVIREKLINYLNDNQIKTIENEEFRFMSDLSNIVHNEGFRKRTVKVLNAKGYYGV